MTATGTKVVGYTRVSRIAGRDKEPGSFISPDLQREQIASVAKREGLKVVTILEELDASGGDGSRPLWNEALEMVERREVQGMVVWNLARFSRSVKDALTALERIEKAGGRLYSATEQFGDDPSGRMLRNILLAVAENERERAKVGFRAAAHNALDRGIFIGGTIPVGYRRNQDRALEIDPDKAPIVQGLFERRAKGMSWAKLAEWAIDQGHDCTDKGVHYIIRNKTYLGQVRYGSEVRESTHPALVTKSLWNKCQEKGKRSARSGRLAGKFLLQGIVICGSCGNVLYLSSGGRRSHAFYYCRRPRQVCSERAYANARALDDHVVNRVVAHLESYGSSPLQVAVKMEDAAAIDEAEFAVREAQADLDGYLSDTTLRRTLGDAKYTETVANYVTVLNVAQAVLGEARTAGEAKFDLLGRQWLHEWGVPERHEWLARIIYDCHVAKGREPLSERVTIRLQKTGTNIPTEEIGNLWPYEPDE